MKVKHHEKLMSTLNSTKSDEQQLDWPGVRNYNECLSTIVTILGSSDREMKLEDIVPRFKVGRGVRVGRDISTVLYQLEKTGVVTRLSKDGIAYFKIRSPASKNKKQHSGLPPYVSKKGRKFKARVTINGVLTTVGVFDTPEKAHEAAVLAKNHNGQESSGIVSQVFQKIVCLVSKLKGNT